MSEISRCKWDREQSQYVKPDGEPCDQPRREHCQARRSCGIHLGWGELTCARCVGRFKTTVQRVADLAPLMDAAATEAARIDSEAMVLAGPGVDPRAWLEYRLAATRHLDHWLKTGRINEDQHTAARNQIDDDETHPYNVLTRWHMMLAEDYSHPLPERMTIAGSAAYLIRHAHVVAQDETQDFALMRKEVGKVRDRLESSLRISHFVQRGVECPDCRPEAVERKQPPPRLFRIYSHWCDDPECAKVHIATDELDIWQCPKVKDHWWSHEDYDKRLEERRAS